MDEIIVKVYEASYEFETYHEACNRGKFEYLKGHKVEIFLDGELDEDFELWKDCYD